MKKNKRRGLIKKGLVWSVALSAMATLGLASTDEQKPEQENEHSCHCEMDAHEAGAAAPNVSAMREAGSASVQYPTDPMEKIKERFVTDAMLRMLERTTPGFSYAYTGENLSCYCEQPVFVKDYFRNMTEEFITNDDEQNCGYVALAMLLSYYDTYWNSSIIEDKYQTSRKAHLDSLSDQDFVSPGIKDLNLPVWDANHPRPDKPGENATEQEIIDYKKAITRAYNLYLEQATKWEYVNQYLMSYLYKLGMEAGVLKFNSHPVPKTTLDGLKEIMSKYTKHSDAMYCESPEKSLISLDYRYFDSVRFDYCETEEERYQAIRNGIISSLKKGRPLILDGELRGDDLSSGEPGYHAVIAYEYDEQNDTIYGHSGWKIEGGSRVNLDELYAHIRGYAWLEVSSDLRYSQNNLTFEVDGVGYDTCHLSSHSHGYTGRINYGHALFHATQCPCGDIKYAYHILNRVSIWHKRCSLCGYLVEDYDPDWRPDPYRL